MTKLIFLDIDGVLNSLDWYIRRQELTKDFMTDDRWEFDPDAVSRLNSLIKTTDAKIVVSSSWRRDDEQYLLNLFEHVGIVGEVIGETRRLNNLITEAGIWIPRGLEIKEYLARVHGYPCYGWDVGSTTDVETYVILDDDSDMLYEQKDHFVHTNMETGLTDECVDKAISILNKETEHGTH